LKFVLFYEILNSRIDQNWLWPIDWVECWRQKSQQKKLIILRNFLYETCRELLDLSTLWINLDSGQRGGLDLDYTLWDLKLRTFCAPCSLNETRWDLWHWKAIDERNNFRDEGAAILDHLQGRFGSTWPKIRSISKT
jgi:hypothetical protein